MGTTMVGGSGPSVTSDPAAAMPGYVANPTSPTLPLTASHEEVKLRGFMAKQDEQQEDSELVSLLPVKDNGRAQYEEVAWLAVPTPGGGIKFYNYVSRKARNEHPSKLSREFHFRPESRLRVAEDTIVALTRGLVSSYRSLTKANDAQVEEITELQARADAATTQVQLLKDEVKANTRHRWYSNHRARWHNDPATTLQIDWGQMAGITAKACAAIVNGHHGKGADVDSIEDAVHIAQAVCDKVLSGMGLAAYVAYAGGGDYDRSTR
eukprot:scaffold215930_cov50-Prasinocladus_malaysianus.AAC.2